MVDAKGKPLFSKQPTFEEFSNAFSTQEERELLKKATSDAGFHYMGSGKIMAGIGKGFAEAMIELNEKRP